jgi:hypothetical protein
MKKVLSGIFLLCSIIVFGQGSFEVINGLSHTYNSAPGSEHAGIMIIRNLTDQDVPISVKQKDYRFFADGSSFYEDTLENVKSNKEWVTYLAQDVTLPASKDLEIPFSVKVPEGEYIGTYWSVFMIEPVSVLDHDAPDQGVGISTVIRYAIQIVNEFEDKGNADVEYVGVNLESKEGINVLTIGVQNKGDAMVRPELSVDIYNTESGEVKEYNYEIAKRIYPNTSVSYSLPLEDLLPGSYTAVLMTDCGDDQVYGLNLEFDIKPEEEKKE